MAERVQHVVRVTELSREELLRQPIGYWTGEAHARIGDALRAALRSNDLSQPQWWILNKLAHSSGPVDRAAVLDELAPFNDNEERRDLGAELDDVVERRLVDADDRTIAGVTDAGEQARRRSVELNGAAHLSMIAGVSDADYATTIDVLRQVVGNLGGADEVWAAPRSCAVESSEKYSPYALRPLACLAKVSVASAGMEACWHRCCTR